MTRTFIVSAISLALGGCFTEPMLEGGPGSGDDGGLTGGATTGGDDGSATASSVSKGDTQTGNTSNATSTGVDDGSSGGAASADDDGSSSGTTAYESSSETSDGSGEESGSTGSTGEMILTVPELLAGDLIVTEVMWNPGCQFDECEWIEVYNTLDQPIDLQGLRVDDASGNGSRGLVTTNVVLEPAGFAVLAFSDLSWPYPEPPDALYGVVHLNNSDPERVILLGEDVVLDETPLFSVGGLEEGRSTALANASFDHIINDDEAAWCGSSTELDAAGDIEYGTPGEANDC